MTWRCIFVREFLLWAASMSVNRRRGKAWPENPRGTEAAGLDSIKFFEQLVVMLFSYQAMLICLQSVQIGRWSAPQFNFSGSFCITKTPSISKSVSKARKTIKAKVKACRSTSQFMKNDFHENAMLPYTPCENLDVQVQKRRHVNPEIDKNMAWK